MTDRLVLVFTKASKKKEIGEVITYDKKGKIGIFHKRCKLTKKLKPKQLVLCKVITEQSTFYLLKPLTIITNGRIPKEYQNIEVWGEKSHLELMKQRKKR